MDRLSLPIKAAILLHRQLRSALECAYLIHCQTAATHLVVQEGVRAEVLPLDKSK